MKLEGISSILALACWSSWNIWLRGATWKFNSEFTPENTPSPKKKGEQSSNHNFSRAILNFGVNFGVYFLNDFLIFFGIQWFHHFAPLSLWWFYQKASQKATPAKNQFLPSRLNSWKPSANWFLQNRIWISELGMVEDDWSKARIFWRLANVTSSSSQNLSSLLQVWCAEETAEESSSLIALSVFVVEWWNECYSISNQNDDPSWDLLSS